MKKPDLYHDPFMDTNSVIDSVAITKHPEPHLLFASHYSKCFKCIVLSNPHNNPMLIGTIYIPILLIRK